MTEVKGLTRQQMCDRLAMEFAGRLGRQSRYRHSDAVLEFRFRRHRDHLPRRERRRRLWSADRRRQGGSASRQRRRPARHAEPRCRDRAPCRFVRDDPQRPHRRDRTWAPTKWRRTAISPTGRWPARRAAASAARWTSPRAPGTCSWRWSTSTRRGQPRLVERCTIPVTARGVVNLVITNYGLFEVTETAWRCARSRRG